MLGVNLNGRRALTVREYIKVVFRTILRFNLTARVTMKPSDIARADVDALVENLTTDEAISLTAGVGFWHTHSVERLGIPAIKVCFYNGIFSLSRSHSFYIKGF